MPDQVWRHHQKLRIHPKMNTKLRIHPKMNTKLPIHPKLLKWKELFFWELMEEHLKKKMMMMQKLKYLLSNLNLNLLSGVC
ncbi:hypothetical protein EPH_0033990 [Eimeria praecox]|uniref:Uncharacterized protein n=1 Tax=Eimeria praecox TaxID=51316 RepID=U6G4T1_9EIME|nr:hypothetical protein EPH_0033990 [Eimeria praecox]